MLGCGDTAVCPYTEDEPTSEPCSVCGVYLPVCECEGEDTVCIPNVDMAVLVNGGGR